MNVKRKIAALLIFMLASASVLWAQTEPTKVEKIPTVKVRFRNNSIVFRHVTIVTYLPVQEGNGTEGVLLAPYSGKTKTYEVGTKVYFANSKQVDTVMSGKKLEGVPFMVIKAEDEGKTFNIFK